MATLGITANFCTDDHKAANVVVHALFEVSAVQRQMPERTHFEARHTPASECAFLERAKRRLRTCQPTREVA